MSSKLVEFTTDSYPHCKGDVVKLSDSELKEHKKDTYVDYSVKTRAENAPEGEVVEGKDKSYPANEPSVEIAGSAQVKEAAEKGKK